MVFDCIIGGAGPSACAAANVLRQAGLSVCMIGVTQAQAFLVGESLPGAAIPLLDRIGIADFQSWLPPESFHECRGNVSAWGGNDWVRSDAIQNPQGGGWHLDRRKFNDALLVHTLAQSVAFQEAKITTISRHSSCWQVQTSSGKAVQGRYLIDATGRASALAKLLGLKKPHLDRQMAAVAWVESDSEDKEKLTRIKAVEDGWWYSARLPKPSSLGLPIRVVAKFALQKEAKRLAEPQRFIEALNASGCLPITYSQQQLQGPIVATDASVSRLSASEANTNFVAIGDAVLSLDPLSSQGMFFALYSGIKGAEAIIQQVEGDSGVKNLERYYAEIQRVFEKHQDSRRLYYASEYRFASSEYWRAKVR